MSWGVSVQAGGRSPSSPCFPSLFPLFSLLRWSAGPPPPPPLSRNWVERPDFWSSVSLICFCLLRYSYIVYSSPHFNNSIQCIITTVKTVPSPPESPLHLHPASGSHLSPCNLVLSRMSYMQWNHTVLKVFSVALMNSGVSPFASLLL